MYNDELAKKYQVSPSTRKECPTNLVGCICKANASHVDENIAAVCKSK